LQFLFQAPPQLAFFNCGGVRIMLDNPVDKEFANHSNILYFKVSDINATYESLKSGGAEFVDKPHLIAKMPDHELWMAFFRDGEGNTHALMCEKR
jgi:methylmalonyl-CoA/ethylmalonyl-CoA epimerase